MGAGVEFRDLNDGEGLVIEFDVDVVFTELDFQSLDDGMVTVTIESVGSFDFVDDGQSDTFPNPFGIVLIPAGADVTFSMSSPTVPGGTARIAEFTVATSLEDVSFVFSNQSAFDDDQGIGTAMTASSLDGNNTIMLTLVDLFAPEFVNGAPTTNILRASAGDAVTSDVGSNSLGVNNPSVTDDDFFMGAGIETRDINDQEGLVIEFDQDVVITEIDFASLDDGTVTIAVEGGGSFDFVVDDINNPTDTFSFPVGTEFVSAGSDITISLASPDVPDASVRISSIQVSTSEVMTLKGDVDLNGVIDFFDIQPFIDALADGTNQPEADIDCSGTVDFFDIQPFIDALSGATNQPEADVDCNGMVEFFDIQPFIDILAGNP